MAGNDWLAALPLAGGLIDTAVSSRTSRRNVDKTVRHNKAESELAYQRQIEMWHMQNEFNSPAEQMKRFGAAGLNPHLIYGQGSAGNAASASPPNYQPSQAQYKYEAPAYGASIGAILPTLMAVGTWMQNMKASEVEIRSKETGMDKTRQLVEYLEAQNPKKLQDLDNKLSLFPYQQSMQRELAQKAQVNVADLLEEFKYKWGSPLQTEFADYKHAEGGGLKSIEFMRKLAEQKLKTAQASWTDMNITNPQQLIQMVLGGVMGLAGKTLRFNQAARSAPVKMIGKGQRGRWSLNRNRR